MFSENNMTKIRNSAILRYDKIDSLIHFGYDFSFLRGVKSNLSKKVKINSYSHNNSMS
jgi:hypothetical protein